MSEKVKDLVCGMEFDKNMAIGTFDYKGRKYYFCSPGCRDKFVQDPEKTIDQGEK
ncbi:MAG: YHS domain-containing protein [Candidatus Aminicenantaceae bacterium]